MPARGKGDLLGDFLKSAPKPVQHVAGREGAIAATRGEGASTDLVAGAFQRLDVGIHYDVNEAIYHADPCIEPSLSASFGTMMLDNSPARARASHPRLNPGAPPFTPTTAMDEGSILHRLLTGVGPEFHVVDADSWRTDAAKAKKAAARAAGAIPVLVEALAELEAVADVARAILMDCPENRQILSDDYASEVTCISRERTGALCRVRPDRLHRTDGGAPIYDFKFTDKMDHPVDWDRTIENSHWDMRAAFYVRCLAELRDGEEPPYRFVVVQKKPPVDVMVFELTESFLKQGHAKAALVINAWERCMAANRWPPYPRRTFYVEEPGWAERRLRDRTYFFEQMLPGAPPAAGDQPPLG